MNIYAIGVLLLDCFENKIEEQGEGRKVGEEVVEGGRRGRLCLRAGS